MMRTTGRTRRARLILLVAAMATLGLTAVAMLGSRLDQDESSAPPRAPTATPPLAGAPPGAIPPTGTPSSREVYEQVAQRELEKGLVAYTTPTRGRVKQEFDVTVRVQRGDVTESPGLRPTASPGPVIVESLPVGTYMRGELRGSGFDIEPLSDNLQLIDGVTEWAWRVTPQADGRRTLRLTLVVELDDLPLSSRTFDRSIDVAVEEQPPWYQRSAGLLDLGGVVTALAIASILGAAKVGRVWWARRTPKAGASKDALQTVAGTPDVTAQEATVDEAPALEESPAAHVPPSGAENAQNP